MALIIYIASCRCFHSNSPSKLLVIQKLTTDLGAFIIMFCSAVSVTFIKQSVT